MAGNAYRSTQLAQEPDTALKRRSRAVKDMGDTELPSNDEVAASGPSTRIRDLANVGMVLKAGARYR